MTAPVAGNPVRDDGVTTGARCACCGQGFRARGRRRFCSAACRQHAYRQRRQTALPAPRAKAVPQIVYECPACATRLLGEQRCPDCNLFCRRLGPGGLCPHCDEPITLTDLS